MPLISETYREHLDKKVMQDVTFSKDTYRKTFLKKHRGNVQNLPCYAIQRKEDDCFIISTSYFIGVDWVEEGERALYVAPKLNKDHQELDFIKMLFTALNHSEVNADFSTLFEVKWEKPAIAIEQKQDLLTPLLIVEFLSILKRIVRKGLKKSYYKVEKNLDSKVKGKLLVGKTITQNQMKNRMLYSYCSYDEFSLDNKENRLLKKALEFIKCYLPSNPQIADVSDFQNTFNYINPAFTEVSDKIELNEIKQTKSNAFYKEYEPALRLAKLILQRFGYNISNTVKQKIKTPPFWIDMSALFELYVLALLKDRFHSDVKFQFSAGRGNILDYLLVNKNHKMVIDAKYIPRWKYNPVHENVRQVSGYARLTKVYETLGQNMTKNIDCLIVYPDQEEGVTSFCEEFIPISPEERLKNQVKGYEGIYKLGVKLPVILNSPLIINHYKK